MVMPGPVPAATQEVAIVNGSPEEEQFFTLVDTYLSARDRPRVRKAYDFAQRKHGDQRRKSGELFFTHPRTVAYYLAEYRLDAPALMAALLHDVAEDTRVSVAEIRRRFGAEVSRLVDGVTKLKEVTSRNGRGREMTTEEVRDATLHKLFEAMTADERVIIIKLFDRLHNLRTIDALPPAKQQQKARETLMVYAPLANRLGIWRLKSELEALSLRALDSAAYQAIKQQLESQFHKQQADYAAITSQIIECLVGQDVGVVNVLPNPQSIYTVYQSLAATSAPPRNADSTLRVVVLLEDIPSCYLALGLLHHLWRPVPGKFDDYIALPRDNLYRSLHTTVIHSSGQPLKIRFRTVAMNEVSEIGVLARWVYASAPLWSREIDDRVEALFANVRENIRLEPQNVSAGVKGVVEDVFRKQIMVYTPRGDVIELPQGATPVDFAFTIHTEVGNQCQMAYVNEKPYPLNKPLHDGDRVRIVKSGWARPQRTWLDEDLGFLTTGRARAPVRRWFRRLPRKIAVAEGKKLLQDELKMLGLEEKSPDEVALLFGFDQPQGLYYALGRAELLPTTVATHVLAEDWYLEPLRNVGSVVHTETGEEFVITNASYRHLRLCRACNARPGDPIVGFLRSDGGVTVHREECYTLRPDPLAERVIKLDWGKEGIQGVRVVTVQINVYDRTGLLFEIAELLRDENINIAAIYTPPGPGEGKLQVVLDLEVVSPRQLVRVLHRAHALVNVYSVYCLPKERSGTAAIPTRYLPE